jgi:hypothetical protein
MKARSAFRHLALFGIALTFAGCSEPTQPAAGSLEELSVTAANAAGGGTTLFFNGADANASTPLGTVLTTQIDDIAFDAMVRFEGGNSAESHQMIYYNGHGAVSGWGIIVLGAPHGLPDGTIGILSGGIDIPLTPFVLTPGVWQHVSAERRAGVVTVTLDDQSYVVGPLPVNPIGGAFAGIERTTVGGDGTFDAPTGDFHGAIEKVRVRDLATDEWVERWNFNEGQGATATGVKGTVLYVGNAVWARRGGN